MGALARNAKETASEVRDSTSFTYVPLLSLMVEKKIPCFESAKIVRVNYEDGCKVYFADNSFVICRFSGTEPLLRIFAEASTEELATAYIAEFRTMLNLD